jgi:hypothetical protein
VCSVGELLTACLADTLHFVTGFCKRETQTYHVVLELLEMRPFCFKACRATRKEVVGHSSIEAEDITTCRFLSLHNRTFYLQTRQLTSDFNTQDFVETCAPRSL